MLTLQISKSYMNPTEVETLLHHANAKLSRM